MSSLVGMKFSENLCVFLWLEKCLVVSELGLGAGNAAYSACGCDAGSLRTESREAYLYGDVRALR